MAVSGVWGGGQSIVAVSWGKEWWAFDCGSQMGSGVAGRNCGSQMGFGAVGKPQNFVTLMQIFGIFRHAQAVRGAFLFKTSRVNKINVPQPVEQQDERIDSSRIEIGN